MWDVVQFVGVIWEVVLTCLRCKESSPCICIIWDGGAFAQSDGGAFAQSDGEAY